MSVFALGIDFEAIQWESEAMAMSRHFQPQNVTSKRRPSRVRVLQEGDNPNDFSISSLYKCVAVCGCGDTVTDDISTIEKEQDQNK